MVGAAGTGYLVTLVERVTRFALVGWVPTKEADVVTAEIIRLFRGIGVICTGITFDNGKEFAGHAEISCALELRDGVFFATPYHSWERGTNENTNGLIRRLYPRSPRSHRSARRNPADRRVPERPSEEVSRLEDAEGGDGRLPCRSRVSGILPQRARPHPSPRPLRRNTAGGGGEGPALLCPFATRLPALSRFSLAKPPLSCQNDPHSAPEGSVRPPASGQRCAGRWLAGRNES